MFRIPIRVNDDSTAGLDSAGPLDDVELIDGKGQLALVFGRQNYVTFALEEVQAKGRCL